MTTFRDISKGGFLVFIIVYTGLPPQEQHEKWLHNNIIRQTIWDRISFEDEMILSLEARASETLDAK